MLHELPDLSSFFDGFFAVVSVLPWCHLLSELAFFGFCSGTFAAMKMAASVFARVKLTRFSGSFCFGSAYRGHELPPRVLFITPPSPSQGKRLLLIAVFGVNTCIYSMLLLVVFVALFGLEVSSHDCRLPPIVYMEVLYRNALFPLPTIFVQRFDGFVMKPKEL